MKAIFTPISKYGKRKDPGNYQPASLASVPGKVVERIIVEIVKNHVEDNRVIRSTGVVRMDSQGEIMLN